MPFEEAEETPAQLLQRKRSENFAPQTAERIRAAEHCLFSLMPYEDLTRRAIGWYEACSQAMLRGNFGPVDEWVRSTSQLAAEQGFALEDLLELLRICRRSAIDLERWDEGAISVVDEVINEGLQTMRSKVTWDIPEHLNYLTVASSESKPGVPSVPGMAEEEKQASERRGKARNRLQLPIRVCGTSDQGVVEEITRTQNVSRGGLYFMTREIYETEQILKVTYPYWTEHGGINKEYSAKVVRRDQLQGAVWGIAVDFLESLGRKAQ